MGLLYAILMILALLLTPMCLMCYVYYTNQEKKREVEKSKMVEPTMSEKEIVDILYAMIEREWTYRVKFHYKLKDIRIPNFEIEVEYLVRKVMHSIAPGLMSELKYYYNEDSIIHLVSHIAQILVLEYIDAHRPKSTHIRI